MPDRSAADGRYATRSGRPPEPELVVPDLGSTVRWHEHDFPHPLARWHTHPEVEIHLIRRSSGLALVGDYAGRFRPGHLAIVGAHLPHNWISDLTPGEIISGRDVVLQIDPDRIRGLARYMPEATDALRLFRQAARGIVYVGPCARAAADDMEGIGSSTGLERIHHLFRLLALLLHAPDAERRVLSQMSGNAELDTIAQDRIDTIFGYINDNLTGEVRLTDAAKAVSMSPSALSHFFTRTAGRGFVETVRRIRVIRACSLLVDTDDPISSICHDVGFRNLSNFNRQFRAETGMTPREYRRGRDRVMGAAP